MNGRAVRLVPYLLAFFSSLCIMILELVASRLVARHVGASLSVWTSVIGIMLGGICLGNVLGGRLADRIGSARALSPLYALGAGLTLGILWVNSLLGFLPGLQSLPLTFETILVVSLDFLIPGTVLGMIGPVVAKMAVEQARHSGGALGDVYFLGAVGSIVGTFLAGFVLMYLAPTSTIVILVAAALTFVGFVLVRDGELSGGNVTAALIGVAVVLLLAGLVVLAGMFFGSKATPSSTRNLEQAVAWLSYAVLATLGAACLSATLASLAQVDARSFAGVAAVALLALGSIETINGRFAAPGIRLGSMKLNAFGLSGSLIVLGLAVDACLRLRRALSEAEMVSPVEIAKMGPTTGEHRPVNLNDLSALAFVSSLAFMALEMVAGRLVTRNLGSSIYGWTSVIGVLLGGLSLGNWLGGRIADRIREEKQAATLFLVASVLAAGILLAETPRGWMVRNPIEYFFQDKPGVPLAGDTGPVLSMVSGMTGWPWELRILFWVSVEFLLPAMALGTVGPVVAKLAVERVRAQTKGTGAAIGQVYAWGMVGSILGTFAAGFFLIDVFGTKGMILLLSAGLAIAATVLGKVRHAAWAGIPLGLCVIAFLPSVLPANSGIKALDRTRNFLVIQGQGWGLREDAYDPGKTDNGLAYIDESNYYYIKITNEAADDAQKRTLVLDNLIHGYFIKDHPERLDYDYEHIYALVTARVMEAKARAAKSGKVADQPLSTLFLGGGSYTFPRYLQHEYPRTKADVAEIDPAVTEANHRALWLPRDTTIKTSWGDARQFVAARKDARYDLVFGDAFNDFSVPWHLTTREFNDKINGLLTDDGVYMINIIDMYTRDDKAIAEALFKSECAAVEKALAAAGMGDAARMAKKIVNGLGVQGLGVDTSRIASVVNKAVEKFDAIVSPRVLEAAIAKALDDAKIPMRGKADELIEAVKTVFSEDKGAMKFAARIPSWAGAAVEADVKYAYDVNLQAIDSAHAVAEARGFGAFLGSWVETARKSFGPNVYVFGTASAPGQGQRETFVVVASRKPLDLDELGRRHDEPHFFDRDGALVAPEAYDKSHMSAIKLRSRGILLTDDYAPVENLLAPVAKTRADDE